MSIPAPVQNPIPLCAPMLGLAGSGYGTCQIKSPKRWLSFTSTTPMDKVHPFNIDCGKIHEGQGEYILCHKSPCSLFPSRDTFDQAYQIINDYAPAAILNNRPESLAIEECENRYAIIQAKIQALDPTLQAIFIPRTLLELVLIRKCIQEDLKNKEICAYVNPYAHQEKPRTKSKCWHLCSFDNMGDNNHPGVKDIAFRLNRVLLKAFAPTSDGFTYQEFASFAEKELTFLKTHYQNGLLGLQTLGNCNDPGPTTNFGFESINGTIKPMRIRNENDAQIIREAVALNCSKAARNHFFLYRGAMFAQDCPNVGIDPYGINVGAKTLQHLKSDLTRNELIRQFNHYKQTSIHLGHPKCIKRPNGPVSKL